MSDNLLLIEEKGLSGLSFSSRYSDTYSNIFTIRFKNVELADILLILNNVLDNYNISLIKIKKHRGGV